MGSYSRSMSELILDWFPRRFGTSFQMGLACFAGLGWAAWLTRNKIYMQKSFPAKPIEVIYNALSFVQKWRPLINPWRRYWRT
jgi:hypothetical protein